VPLLIDFFFDAFVQNIVINQILQYYTFIYCMHPSLKKNNSLNEHKKKHGKIST